MNFHNSRLKKVVLENERAIKCRFENFKSSYFSPTTYRIFANIFLNHYKSTFYK